MQQLYLTKIVQFGMIVTVEPVLPRKCDPKEGNTLLITREIDYAMRVLRGLKDGQMHAVPDLTQDQMIPQAFTYKIIKKLARAGLVEVVRGSAGGCRLKADLEQVSLADLMTVMEGSRCLSACMDPAYVCPWRQSNHSCTIHCRLAEIQQRLEEELQRYRLSSLLGEDTAPPPATEKKAP